MELRNSAKIAIASVAALGTIGALHFMVFATSAAKYERAVSSYGAEVSNYQAQGRPPEFREINAFEYRTRKYQLEYWEMVKELDISIPEKFAPASDGGMNESQLKAFYWDFHDRLQELRARGEQDPNTVSLDFLGTTGWNLANELPSWYRENLVAPEDTFRDLDIKNQLLTQLEEDTPIYQTQESEYFTLLTRIGLNLSQRAFLEEQFGRVAAIVHSLNRASLIRDALNEANYFRQATESQINNQLYELFRLEWPEDWLGNENFHPADRQSRLLLDLIQAADETGIQSIVRVVMHPPMAVYWQDPAELEEEETEETGFDEMDWEMWGGDPYAMYMFGGGGGYGGMMTPTPTPAAEFDAVNTPLEITVVGTNQAVFDFLYRKANEVAPLELDRIRITSLQAQDANQTTGEELVRATAYFGVVTSAKETLRLFDKDIDMKIVEARRALAEVATKAGAGELAVQDGLVVQEGSSFRLVEPSPTPWPQ